VTVTIPNGSSVTSITLSAIPKSLQTAGRTVYREIYRSDDGQPFQPGGVTSGDSLADGISEAFGVKAANTNANLSGLTISAGFLSPLFATGTLSYTTTVVSNNSTETITPTIMDNATTTLEINVASTGAPIML
jgi:hypothetical protein